MAKAMSHSEFIRRARSAHGDVYDYSQVSYVNVKTKVRIICPTHGVFEQTPEKHLMGRGCPECGKLRSKQTNLEKYGVEHPLQSAEIRDQIHQNNLLKYGTEYPQSLDFVKDRIRSTNQKRYGVENPMLDESVREHHHDVMREKYGGCSPFCDASVVEKADATRLERYGVSHPFDSDVILNKSKQTCIEKYGMEYALQSDAVRQKARETCLSRYGVEHPFQNEDILRKTRESLFEHHHVCNAMKHRDFVCRCMDSKRRNGTFSSSSCEESLYILLVSYFGENDVLRQYRSGEYPFACDFYIQSLDLYIELNAHWTHGFHWFDSMNSDDVNRLEQWKQSGGKFYQNAVHVWMESDVRKRRCASDYDLNYVVFWRNDLMDVYDWIKQGCPVRKDWM